LQSDTQFVILTKSRRDPQKPKEIEMRMNREFYMNQIPFEARIIEREGGVGWEYEKEGVPCAMLFRGKAQKPTAWHRFQTEEKRTAFIEKFFQEIQQNIEWKRKRKEEAAKELEKAYGGLEVGAIFSSSWGYEQTNVSFYQVVEIKGKNLTVQAIGKRIVSEGGTSEWVVPEPEIKIGETFTKRLNSTGGLTMNSYEYASPYTCGSEGQYQTAYGFGH
jgi:hypothetical protein